MAHRLKISLAALLCVIAASGQARADLALDTTFETDGFAEINFAPNLDSARDTAVQTDGKCVLVGLSRQISGADTTSYVGIARLDANGVLDSDFANGGTLALLPAGTPQDDSDGDGRAVAIQPLDQKVVVAGTWDANDSSNQQVFVLRLDTDGGLDPAFGTGGAAVFELPGLLGARAEAVALQSDGGIVIAGGANNASVQRGFIARLDSVGNLDSSFATGGVFSMDSPVGLGLPMSFKAVTVFGDDAIVAGGGGNDLVVVRLTDVGQPDTTFSDDGIASFNVSSVDLGGVVIGSFDDVNGLAVRTDESIVLAGSTRPALTSLNVDAIPASVTATGDLDTTFGVDGYALLPNRVTQESAFDVVALPAGGFVVAGLGFKPFQFSDDGMESAELPGAFPPQSINGLALFDAGRVVGGGEQNIAGANSEFVALRVRVSDLGNPSCEGFEGILFCGDTTGDCMITASDALAILRIAVGLGQPTDACNG